MSLDLHAECKLLLDPHPCTASSDQHHRGKSIAIRLAEDGFDVCVNDIAANQAGIDEVSRRVDAHPLLRMELTEAAHRRRSKKFKLSVETLMVTLQMFPSSPKSKASSTQPSSILGPSMS